MALPVVNTNPAYGLRGTVPGVAFSFGVDGGGANGSNAGSGVSEIITDSITSQALHPTLQNVTQVNLTAAQFNGMFATPVTLIAAPGAGKSIVVDSCLLRYVGGGSAFAGGGAVSIQYSGGSVVLTTVAASQFTTTTSSDNFMQGTGATYVTSQNTAITITNATAAFTTGTGTFQLYLYYSVL